MRHYRAELTLTVKGVFTEWPKFISEAFLGDRLEKYGSFNGTIEQLGKTKYSVRFSDSPYCDGYEIESYCKKLADMLPDCAYSLCGTIYNEGTAGDYKDELRAAYSEGVLKFKYYSGYERKINTRRPTYSNETVIRVKLV